MLVDYASNVSDPQLGPSLSRIRATCLLTVASPCRARPTRGSHPLGESYRSALATSAPCRRICTARHRVQIVGGVQIPGYGEGDVRAACTIRVLIGRRSVWSSGPA